MKLETGDLSGRLDKIITKLDSVIDHMTNPSKYKQAGTSETT